MSKTSAIGIDLGTTYSCVGVYENGNVTIISNDQGNRTTPSYVAFTETERLIGDAAKNQANINYENTVHDVKRLIGRRFGEESLQNDLRNCAYKVVDENDKPIVQVQYKGEECKYSPEQVSSMILQKMKQIAESYLGHPVTDAVITVPAYFNDAQRQATKDAGTIAGLNVLRIINEPTAAAIAYGLQKKTEDEQNILVYDLGGGTFDVSILTLCEGIYEVKSVAGNTRLGGSDFDSIITDFLVDDFLKKNKNLSRDDITDKTKRRLRTQAERLKRNLSASASATIEIDSLCKGVDYNTTISRAKFEELCGKMFKNTLVEVEKALTDAKMSKGDIHEIVLVGGSTRIPKVQQLLSEFFNGKELCKGINPDEAVAYGATIQASILTGTATGDANNIVLVDVTPLSLGIETGDNGAMTVIIPRNSSVPCKKTRDNFSTARDNQTAVTIQVFEGERGFTKFNNLLGKFNLEGIAPAPRGVPQIEVTFDVNSNGILTVSAKNKATGEEQKISIENNTGKLSKEDIERMVNEGKQFEEEDKANLEKLNAKNDFEQTLYRVKSSLDDVLKDDSHNDKVQQEDVDKVREYLEECQSWFDSNSDATKDDYETRSKKLNELFHPISSVMYGSDDSNSQMPGMSGGMPNLSPEQMAQFQEMMKDPAKREQMENMAKQFTGMNMGSNNSENDQYQSPTVDEVD